MFSISRLPATSGGTHECSKEAGADLRDIGVSLVRPCTPRKRVINIAIIACLDSLTCVSRITADLVSKAKFMITNSGIITIRKIYIYVTGTADTATSLARSLSFSLA